MKLKNKIVFIFRRASVFTRAFFILKNFRAAYLLSKHQHHFRKNIKGRVQWKKGMFLLVDKNQFLSVKNFHQIQGDFNLLFEVSEFGKIRIPEEDLAVEMHAGTKPLFYFVNNHDILSVIKEIIIDKTYLFREFNDKQFVVMDVGMNVGVASLYFASLDNVKKIFAYEPLKLNYKLAQKNFEKNTDLAGKIIVFNYGLDNTDTEMELPFAHEGDLGFSTSDFVLEKTKNKPVVKGRVEKIQIKNIENELISIKNKFPGYRIMLKLDCEGTEYNIIQLLSDKSLLDLVYLVVVEWHYKGPDILVQLLIKNNFRIIHQEDHYNNYTGIIKAVKNDE